MSEPSMGTLTDSERAELDQLRADKAAADAAPAAPAIPPPPPVQKYWLHLANGDVIETDGQMTMYQGIQVIGAYPVTEKEA